MPRARMMHASVKGMIARFLCLFLMIIFAIPSWGLVATQQYDDCRYDGSRIVEHTQNYDCGVVHKLSGDGVRQTIGALSDKAQEESFFAFADGFFGANSVGAVDAEAAALRRMGQNPNGPDLTSRAPNTILNQQQAKDLASGKLPGNPIGGPGTPREMPASWNSSATAENFASQFFGGSVPTNAKPIPGCAGCWRAQTNDGTWVTYRPAGQASKDTLPTTATVEINAKATGNASNNGQVLKLKFPSR